MGKIKRVSPDELAANVGFTQEDLEANRMGSLSPEQQVKFANASIHYRRLALLLIGAVIVLIVFVSPIVFHPLNRADDPGTLMIFGFLVFPCVFAAMYWFRSRALRHALEACQVASVEGPINVELASGDEMAGSIWVGETRIIVRMLRPALTFQNGEPYLVYYEPHSMEFLSAERRS